MNFIQQYIYHQKTDKEVVEMRMRQCKKMKTKTKKTIISDLCNLKDHFKRRNLQAYYGGII